MCDLLFAFFLLTLGSLRTLQRKREPDLSVNLCQRRPDSGLTIPSASRWPDLVLLFWLFQTALLCKLFGKESLCLNWHPCSNCSECLGKTKIFLAGTWLTNPDGPRMQGGTDRVLSLLKWLTETKIGCAESSDEFVWKQ
jgi:hypothetical protein